MNEEMIDAQERLLTSSFDKAKSYSQVVLGIGYVSIFAAWGFTKEYLTRGEVLWSALLACISVAFFVIFDIFTTFINSRTVLNLAAAIQNPERFHKMMEVQKKKDIKWLLIYSRAWVVCWPVSFLTGIGSGGILLWAFASHLWTGN